MNEEQLKLFVGFFNQVLTLSTALVVLIPIFLERLFPKPRWKFLAGLALVGFMVAVVGALQAQWSLIVITTEFPSPMQVERSSVLGLWGLIGMRWGFVTAIVTLTMFGLINLFTSQHTA